MKYKVLKEFKDLKEDILRKPGDIIDITATRAKEIEVGLSKFCSNSKWIEKVEEPKKKG